MSTKDALAPASAVKPAHRDGNVLRWLVAYSASVIGDSVYFLALGWAALRIGGQAQVGLVMAAGAVPRAVLMLGGGVIADRFGPRKIIIGSDSVRCLVVLSVSIALMVTTPGVWILVVVALIFGAVDAVFLPAIGALPSRITEPSQLARVQGMRALAIRVGGTAGGPVAGFAMAVSGPAAAFAVAAGLFSLSLVFLMLVRIGSLPVGVTHTGPVVATSVWNDLRDGLSYLRRHHVLGRLVTMSALGQLGGVAPLNVGLVLLANQRGWGAAGVGWLVSSYSLGAGASALLITVRGTFSKAGIIQTCALLVGSAGLGCLSLVSSLPASAAVAALVGFVAGIHGALIQALVQTVTQPAYLGRVTSVMTLTSLGLAPLTYPLFSATAELWSLGPVFIVFGVFGFLGGLLGLTSRAVRRAELS
jgi:MFS family permease